MMLFEILDLYYLEQVEHDSLYRWNANFLSTVILRAAQDLSSIKQIISQPPHFHPIIIPWKFFSTWNLFKIQFVCVMLQEFINLIYSNTFTSIFPEL